MIQDRSLCTDHLNYTNYVITTWFVLAVAVFIISTMVGQYVLFSSGLHSFNNVIFADGSVSDNNQLLEIIYNEMLTTRSYCHSNSLYAMERCEYLLKSAEFICDILWKLLRDDMLAHNRNKTMLSGSKFYSFYETPIILNFNGLLVNVSVDLFNFYYFYNLQ